MSNPVDSPPLPVVEAQTTWSEFAGRDDGRPGYVFGDLIRGVVHRLSNKSKEEGETPPVAGSESDAMKVVRGKAPGELVVSVDTESQENDDNTVIEVHFRDAKPWAVWREGGCAPGKEILISGLKSGKLYQLRVRTGNPNGWSPFQISPFVRTMNIAEAAALGFSGGMPVEEGATLRGTALLDTARRLRESIKRDRIFVAERLALQLRRSIGALDMRTATAEEKQACQLCNDQEERVELLFEEAARVRRKLQLLSSDEGWEFQSDSGGVRVMTREDEDSPFAVVKTSSTIDVKPGTAPTDTFLALVATFKEGVMMPRWFPLGILEKNEELATPGELSAVYHMFFKLPFLLRPLISPRDAIVYGQGYDLSEDLAVIIDLEPVDEAKWNEAAWGGGSYPSLDGRIRITLRGCFFFKLLNATQVLCQQIMCTDIKMDLMPPAVSNIISKGVIPAQLIAAVKHRVDNHGGPACPWEEMMQQKKEWYDNVRQRIEESLKNKRSVTNSEVAAKQRRAEVSISSLKRNSKRTRGHLSSSRSALVSILSFALGVLCSTVAAHLGPKMRNRLRFLTIAIPVALLAGASQLE